MSSTTANSNIIERADLWYCDGTSDKVYHATLEKQGPEYVVNFAYGRRGSTLKTGTKTSSPTTLHEARKIYEKLVSEKTAKGYQYVSSNATNSPAKPIPVVQAQNTEKVHCVLLNPIEDQDEFLANDDWYCQPKYDGTRLLLKKQNKHITGYNRKGEQIAVPVEIVESVQASDAYYEDGCANFLVDGELIGSHYHVFDILEVNDASIRNSSFENRIKVLGTLFEDIESDNIHLVKTAFTYGDKVSLYNELFQNNREGIVFKNRFATYVPGRPNSGGLYLKKKFYSTASCIVVEVNSKRSVALGLIDPNKPTTKIVDSIVDVGNCTIPVNYDIPEVGDIVEIKYLYAYRNGSLYQPIYLGKRTDIDGSDCLLDQLKYKS